MDRFCTSEFPAGRQGHVPCGVRLKPDGASLMDWETMWAWMNTPWFTLGETDITLGRVAGLLFILAFAWWFSSLLEQGLRRVALHGRHHATTSTVYAFTRL